LIGETHGKFARRQFGLGQGQVDNLLARCVRD
jgi:hypothetical protein